MGLGCRDEGLCLGFWVEDLVVDIRIINGFLWFRVKGGKGV